MSGVGVGGRGGNGSVGYAERCEWVSCVRVSEWGVGG